MLPAFELAKTFRVFARIATIFGIVIMINFILGPIHCVRFSSFTIGLQKSSVCIQFLSHICT
jgi:hypothetical protein